MDQRVLDQAEIDAATMADEFAEKFDLDWNRSNVEDMMLMLAAAIPPELRQILSLTDPAAAQILNKLDKGGIYG